MQSNTYRLSVIIGFFLVALLSHGSAMAIREPRPTSVDSRIRVLVYSPDDVLNSRVIMVIKLVLNLLEMKKL
jgi:type IV secretory pathway VirB9-like protein